MISFRCNRPNGYMIYISNQIHTEKARGRWPQPSQTRSWRQVAGGVQECMALPLSLITTNAQLRPAAPCTPPPGCAPAHHVRLSCCFSQAHNKPKKFFSKPQQTKKVIISQIILQRKGCGRAHVVGGGRHLRRTGTGPSEGNDACCSLAQACTGGGEKDVGAMQTTREIQS